jgi:hypothetical protein
MKPPSPPVQLHDLMAAVGYLLLRWGNLERRLAGAPPPPDLEEVRALRNLLCHGIEAASADPDAACTPWLQCRGFAGQPVVVTYEELEAAIRALERAR